MNRALVAGVCLLMVVLTVRGALAAGTQINTLGSSYTRLLETPTSANCVTTTNVTCDDSLFTTKTEVAPYLSDAVYSYASDPSVAQTGSAVTGKQLAMSWYSVTSLGPGKWYLQALSQTATTAIYVVPYINETQPSTNVSDRLSFTMTTARVWYDIDVTNAVTKSFNELGYIKLRIASQSGSKQFDEILLIVPPEAKTSSGIQSSYFQIIATGVSQTQMNRLTENEWNLVDLSPTLNTSITNQSCVLKNMSGGVMNLTPNVSVENAGIEGYHLAATWTPTVAKGFVEGENYELACSFSTLGAQIGGLEQYIYVNPHETIMTRLSQFVTSIANIFGLLQSPVKVTQITQYAASTGRTNVVSSVYKGSNAYVGANCSMSLTDSAGLEYVNRTPMGVFGVAGLGLYNFSFNASIASGAPWTVTTFCAVNDSAGSNVTYVDVGTLGVAPISSVTQIYEGLPSVVLLPGAGYAGQTSQVMAQFRVGSTSVTTGSCNLTVYYPANTTKLINAQAMAYSGDDSIWQTTWIPPSFVNAYYPARVLCMSPVIGAMVAQDANVLNVVGGDATLRAIS